MKVASLSLLVLSSLADRADSQFVCNLCPQNGIQNRIGVVVIPFQDDRTCTELETAANSFFISEEQCPGLMTFADPVCCFAPVADGSTSSPTESLAPTAAPTGTPTSAPTTSSEPTVTPSLTPTFGPAPECYDNLQDVLLREKAVYDSTFYREYILCPNTEFLVGNQAAGLTYVNGDAAILPRRNAGYKCGADGKSSNNCKIVGGDFQLISFSGNWPEDQQEPHSNVTITGITFAEGGFATAILGNAGDVTFRDCIFKEHTTVGSIYALYDVQPRRRLGEKIGQHSLISTLLSGGDYDQWKKENERTVERQEELDRDLQISNPDIVNTQNIIVINCLFEGNTIAQPGGFTQSAIISTAFPEDRVQIYDSSFLRNNYNEPDVQLIGSMVETFGPLTIENCCFIDNEVLRYGTVVMKGPRAVLTESGNYGNVVGDENVACDFAIVFPTLDGFENLKDFSCIDYDAPPDFDPTQCAKWSSSAPTVYVKPALDSTMGPTMGPTALPSAAAAGRVIISLSAAAAALTVYFIF